MPDLRALSARFSAAAPLDVALWREAVDLLSTDPAVGHALVSEAAERRDPNLFFPVAMSWMPEGALAHRYSCTPINGKLVFEAWVSCYNANKVLWHYKAAGKSPAAALAAAICRALAEAHRKMPAQEMNAAALRSLSARFSTAVSLDVALWREAIDAILCEPFRRTDQHKLIDIADSRRDPNILFAVALSWLPESANAHGYDTAPATIEAWVSRNGVDSGRWYCEARGKSAPTALAAAICLALAEMKDKEDA